jgi:uncharacterized alpha-E superfamily protein
MISRVAESCFWLMRYLERCDATARLLLIQSGMVLDTVVPAHRSWRPLLIVSGEEPSYLERFGGDAVGDGEQVQKYLTWDDANPASIRSSLAAARENARTVRETISLEMWNSLNSFWLWLNMDETLALYETERQEFYDAVNHHCNVFHGILYKTMLHEEPFDFMRLGLHLERAGHTARILDLHHHALAGRPEVPTEALEAVEWIAILRARYAYEPFFKKRKGSLDGPAVAEFLLQEPGSSIGQRSADMLSKLRSGVINLNVARSVETDVRDVLTHIVDRTAEISRTIGEEYFHAVLAEGEMPAVTEA